MMSDDVDDDDDDDNDDNDVGGMSEYELKRMRNVARNNARLASLGLLVPIVPMIENGEICNISQKYN